MSQRDKIIVAIDGYSSCGKSTFAKAIAKKLGYIFIDTGAMYRAITFEAIRQGAITSEMVDRDRIIEITNSVELSFVYSEAEGISNVAVNGEVLRDEIRSLEVTHRVSDVSAIEQVRERLVAQQQQIGHEGGVVMDGRDIGSVVFPDAEIKIFMTADPAIRGERRYRELIAKGIEANLEEIIEGIINRDRADETRAVSPLRRADDAIVLDNSTMTPEEQMEWFEGIRNEELGVVSCEL